MTVCLNFPFYRRARIFHLYTVRKRISGKILKLFPLKPKYMKAQGKECVWWNDWKTCRPSNISSHQMAVTFETGWRWWSVVACQWSTLRLIPFNIFINHLDNDWDNRTYYALILKQIVGALKMTEKQATLQKDIDKL